MGYEVLDSGGESTSRPDAGAPADVVVLDLDSLPEPEPTPAPWLRRRLAAAPEAATAPVTLRRTAAVVAASLALGAVGGGVLVSRHDRAQQRGAERAALVVQVSTTNVSSTNGGASSTIAHITTQLTNHGPLPVQVLTGTSATGVNVDVLGASPQVAAGGQKLVMVLIPVDCGSQSPDPKVALPVRTADQRRHDVQVDLTQPGSSLRDSVCNGPNNPVGAQLTGPIARPVLRITNSGAEQMRFTISSNLGVGNSQADIVVRTVPTVPVVVRAGSTLDLGLSVTARRCPPDLASWANGSYLSVDGLSPNGTSNPAAGVDLGSLVGAAVARACAR